MSTLVLDRDQRQPHLAAHASGLLRAFNQAGVLAAADVHVAHRLTSLTGERDQTIALAVALAVRAPRLGHVHVDLARIRETAAVDTDEPVNLDGLQWPEPRQWVRRVAESRLATDEDHARQAAHAAREGQAGAVATPLRLVGSWLYLDRYWGEEVQVAAELQARGVSAERDVDLGVLADGLRRLFADELGGRQSLAAASAVLRRFAVVAGGPGTGKTTTVARIVALLCEQAVAAGRPLPLVALAAPTGKAAARLEEAVHDEAQRLDVADPVRTQLRALRAGTLHRLLGRRPGSSSRFRHNHNRRLAHDVVIVDETSMVSLSLMARLVEAMRARARLVLVGDPGQLASIEAGAVLGDIVGPATDRLRLDGRARERLQAVTGRVLTTEPGAESAGSAESARCAEAGDSGATEPGSGIIVLDRIHRFGGGIADLAQAIRRGDGNGVLALLQNPPGDDVLWIPADLAEAGADKLLVPVRDQARVAARLVIQAARAGSAGQAIDYLGAFRILCAHRHGAYGVATWTARIESWLEAVVEGFAAADPWYVGRPLLMTENDYELHLSNGDTGVVVQRADGRVSAAFPRGGEIVDVSPARLGAVQTVYAMTIHKSQGSQFTGAAVLLPDPSSRILTRELLYTAATRARRQLIVVGSEEAVRAAVARPVARASGLRRRLWSED